MPPAEAGPTWRRARRQAKRLGRQLRSGGDIRLGERDRRRRLHRLFGRPNRHSRQLEDGAHQGRSPARAQARAHLVADESDDGRLQPTLLDQGPYSAPHRPLPDGLLADRRLVKTPLRLNERKAPPTASGRGDQSSCPLLQRPKHGRAGRDLAFHSTYPARRRDNAEPTSDWRGGSAPARPHVKAAQVDANDNARPSSSEFNCASVPLLIRPIARKANKRAA